MSIDFKEESYIRVSYNENTTGELDKRPAAEDLAVQTCWQISAFHICVESWHNNELKLGLYLAGVRIATATLRANDPCFRTKAGGDLAKVEVEVCADFGARVVRAKGKVCAVFVCAEFNQVIFAW